MFVATPTNQAPNSQMVAVVTETGGNKERLGERLTGMGSLGSLGYLKIGLEVLSTIAIIG